MTATRWFLALCALAFIVACGGDNGSDTTGDVFIGDDNSADSTPNPDDAVIPDTIGGDVECVPSYYIRGSDGMCIPPTDTSDDSTAIETTETTEDVCAAWAAREGGHYQCGNVEATCTLTFWIDDEAGERCVATCDWISDYADVIQWDEPTNGFTFPAIGDYPPCPCKSVE